MTGCTLKSKPGYLANRSIEFEFLITNNFLLWFTFRYYWISFLGYSRHASNQ